MEHNTKPLLLKRFISDGFDIASLFVLFLLLNLLLSATPLFNTYNQHVSNYQSIEQEVLKNYDSEEINEVLMNNYEYQNELFAATLHSYLLRLLIGFIAEVILYLIVPLCSKDNVTVGKRLCGVLLFDELRQSKANNKQIIARFIFIFLTSSSIYFWVGIYSFLLYPISRFIILILNKKNKTLCDYLSRTMLIEKTSYSSI